MHELPNVIARRTVGTSAGGAGVRLYGKTAESSVVRPCRAGFWVILVF